MNLKLIISLSVLCVSATTAKALSPSGLAHDGVLTRDGNRMEARFNIDLSKTGINSNEALVIEPTIVNGGDSVSLGTIGVYGRRRHIYYVRNIGRPVSGADEVVMREKDAPSDYDFQKWVNYQDWMNGASLHLNYSVYGCCNTMLRSSQQTLARYEQFEPVYIYASPKADASKVCQLSGTAYIDFPVNKTVIYPDYRRNRVELSKIRATIDSVRGDSDYKITEVWLKGYASPESQYAHNTDLARGRVAALKDYIESLYEFAPGVVTTAYEPEDWEGLKRFLETEVFPMANAQEILRIAESDNMAPDEKERLIKTRYPADYEYMHANWFPALRHTDYRITYEVRKFYDPQEIAQVMAISPQKLSLNEFYVLSNVYEPGSDEFNEVFETAVRNFPTDSTANLNAALNAMRRGELGKAAAYLEKAGETPEAIYARGLLGIARKDYAKASECLRQAADAGIKQAEETLGFMRRQDLLVE